MFDWDFNCVPSETEDPEFVFSFADVDWYGLCKLKLGLPFVLIKSALSRVVCSH